MSSMISELSDTLVPPPPTKRRRFTVDSLFEDHRPQAVGVTDLATAKEIRLDRIEADPDQPRHTFDEAKLAELTASIAIEGVLQPIAVRYDGARDVYVVLHGERRWRASKAAGLQVIPAIVRDVPQSRRLIQQLMENIVRDDLNAIDRAAALRLLKTQLGDVAWETVAESVGIRRSRLFQLLGTEKLPISIQDDIRAGRLSEKQSRSLQGLPEGHQQALRDAIVDDDLSADAALRLGRELRRRGIADDAEEARKVIVQLRHTAEARSYRGHGSDDELSSLLSAVAEAAIGGSHERASLKKLADTLDLPAFDAGRVHDEVLALARSLARTPVSGLRPGSPAYASLVALYGALDTALAVEMA